MQLLGKGMSAEFWREVREKDCYAGYREALLSDFEELLSLGDLRALRYSDFKLFFFSFRYFTGFFTQTHPYGRAIPNIDNGFPKRSST